MLPALSDIANGERGSDTSAPGQDDVETATDRMPYFGQDDVTERTIPIPVSPTRTSGLPEADRDPSRVRLLRERLADRAPVSLRGMLGPVPASAVAVVVVLVVAILAGVFLRNMVFSSSTEAGGGVATVEVVEDAPTSTAEATSATDVVFVVDVVGRVHHPGVVRLSSGARVVDAIEAAGGVTEKAAVYRINLARPVVDGEQIVVPGQNDPLPTAPQGTSGSGGDGLIDLNTATATELEELPGIGPVLSERIVDWRTAHGRFTTVDELREVDGIGEKLMSQLRPLVRV